MGSPQGKKYFKGKTRRATPIDADIKKNLITFYIIEIMASK